MLNMMLYNIVLLLTEQVRVKRQKKGITNLIKNSPGKKNNVAPPTTNNILQRVMTEPLFVDIVFSLGGSSFQFYICGINVLKEL